MGGRCFRLCRLNPPAQLVWAVACWTWPVPSSQNPPCPGSASPAEAIALLTLFSTIFPSLTFLSKRLFFGLSRDPKIDPKPPSGLKVGSPRRFFIHFEVVPLFWEFFICFGTNFQQIFNVFFGAFFDVSVCVFQTAEPSKSSPWTVF